MNRAAFASVELARPARLADNSWIFTIQLDGPHRGSRGWAFETHNPDVVSQLLIANRAQERVRIQLELLERYAATPAKIEIAAIDRRPVAVRQSKLPYSQPNDISNAPSLVRIVRLWGAGQIFDNPDGAFYTGALIRAEAERRGDLRGEAYGCLLQAIAESHQGKYSSMRELLDRATFAASADDPWLSVMLTVHWQRYLMRSGDVEASAELLEAALSQARSLNDDALAWQALNALSGLAEMHDHHGAALSRMIEAFELANDADLRFEKLISKTRIGAYNRRLGMPDQAKAILTQILAVVDGDPGFTHLAALTWNDLGMTEEALGDLSAAIESFDRSYGLAMQCGDLTASGLAAYNAGKLCVPLGRREDALAYLDHATEAWAQAGRPTYTGFDLLARWYREVANESWTWETVGELELLLARRQTLHRDVHFSALRALAESLIVLGAPDRAFGYLREELAAKEAYWREVANVASHTAARAHDATEAIRRAEEETVRRQELDRAMQDVLRLNQEKEILIEELRSQSMVLAELAWQDALTGVGNRRWFDTRFAEEFLRSKEFDRPLAIAFVDIDDFKRINDRLSHATGDAVLRRVAEIMRTDLRTTDFVARYGGEEFALILTESDFEVARDVAEHLRVTIACHAWDRIVGDLPVTVSIGVALAHRHERPEQMLAEADSLMYEVKRSGKNAIKVAP